MEDKIDKSDVDDCGCLSDNIDDLGSESLRLWHFPIICTLLYPIIIFCETMWAFTQETMFFHLTMYILKLGEELGCWWVPEIKPLTLKGEPNSLQPAYANTLFDNIKKGLTSDSDCDCDNSDVEITGWNFPIICAILEVTLVIGIILDMTIGRGIIGAIAFILLKLFNCFNYQ